MIEDKKRALLILLAILNWLNVILMGLAILLRFCGH